MKESDELENFSLTRNEKKFLVFMWLFLAVAAIVGCYIRNNF